MRHFRACLAVSASEGHGQRALDGIGRKAQIPIAGRDLTIKIETELVCRGGGLIKIRGANQCHRGKKDGQKMDAPKRIHRFNDMLKSENTQSEK